MFRLHKLWRIAVAAVPLFLWANIVRAGDAAPTAAATPTTAAPTKAPPRKATAKKPAVSPEVTALLGGLRPGQLIAGWKVRSIEGPKDKVMSVTVAKGPLWFCATFTKLGASPYNPPVSTDRYALYFDNIHPTKGSTSRDELKKVLDALAARIKKHEQTVPVPPDM